MTSAAPRTSYTGRSNGSRGDVVIVGAGLAGLFTALKLAPMPSIVISAQPLGSGSSSAWAQAGIAAAVSEGDRVDDHAADTIRAGAGIVDDEIAILLARQAPDRVEDLLRFGVPFDRDIEGRLQLSREAAHGARRILRVKGDLAGKAIMDAVTQAARQAPSIQIMEGLSVHRLAVEDGRVTGVYLSAANGYGAGETVHLPARAVVLATGGAGQLFLPTTNPLGSYGEGLAMAAAAGAVVADAEFVQFHPTALDIGRDPAPLATEALRGEGAILVNGRGERFMAKIHDDAELAPRDIVARAVYREAMSGRGAYLDCREAIGERLGETFPTFQSICEAAGLNPRKEPVPVAPAAHYHMGGVLTGADGRTTVNGLWACGEVASTGAHGANRLASNSLLETVVFGALIAEDILGSMPRRANGKGHVAPIETPAGAVQDDAATGHVRAIRRLMSEHCSVVRNRHDLAVALDSLNNLSQSGQLPPAIGNMVLAASFIAAGALRREESRGAHFRNDFPKPAREFAQRSYLTLAQVQALGKEFAGSAQAEGEPVYATAS